MVDHADSPSVARAAGPREPMLFRYRQEWEGVISPGMAESFLDDSRFFPLPAGFFALGMGRRSNAAEAA